MQALDDELLQVLAFIDQAERGGSPPYRDDVDEFGAEPSPPRTGGHGFHSAVFLMGRSRLDNVSRWLERVGLVECDLLEGGRTSLTAVGRAMLRGAQEASDTILLNPDDELAYPQLVRALSASEELVFADPYVRLEQIHQLLVHTRVTRVLTSGEAITAGEREGIRALIAGMSERDVEVRVSVDKRFHDRFAIEANGRVFMLGASLNGLHKNLTVLAPLGDPEVARLVREHVEELWQGASSVLESGA